MLASTLFRQGIKINMVSKLLGQKDVATTYKIYIHMIPEGMDEAVDAVGKVMMGFQEGLPVLQIEGRDRDLRFAVLLEPAVKGGIGVPFAVVALDGASRNRIRRTVPD